MSKSKGTPEIQNQNLSESKLSEILIGLRRDEQVWSAISQVINAEAYRVLGVLVSCNKDDVERNQGYYQGLYWLMGHCTETLNKALEGNLQKDAEEQAESYTE